MRYTHASFLFPLFFFFFLSFTARKLSSARCYLLLKLSPPPPPPFHTLSNPSRGHPLLLRVFFGKCIYSSILILPVCTTVRGKNDPFCTPCETSVSSDVFVLVKGKKKNIARNASVGVFVLQRIFVQRRGLFIVIESNWLRRRATNEISFAELFRAGSQFVTNYVPCDARERELSCQITGSFAAWVLFLFADTLLECSAVRNFSAGDAVLRSRSHFGVIFVFVGTRSVFALH